MNEKLKEKREIQLFITTGKKEVMQLKKQLKVLHNTNHMLEEDCDKMKGLVKKKKGVKQNCEQEIMQTRKQVRSMEKDVEELTECKDKLKEEINNEKEIGSQI